MSLGNRGGNRYGNRRQQGVNLAPCLLRPFPAADQFAIEKEWAQAQRRTMQMRESLQQPEGGVAMPRMADLHEGISSDASACRTASPKENGTTSTAGRDVSWWTTSRGVSTMGAGLTARASDILHVASRNPPRRGKASQAVA